MTTTPGALAGADTLATWLAPGDMMGKVHKLDLKIGGGDQMSLFYAENDKESVGKTSVKEDRFTSRFIEITPYKKIVQAITFDADDPAFLGEITMETTFEPKDNGTIVTIVFKNIPAGIRPGDNEEGTELSLEKLAHYIE